MFYISQEEDAAQGRLSTFSTQNFALFKEDLFRHAAVISVYIFQKCAFISFEPRGKKNESMFDKKCAILNKLSWNRLQITQ